MIILKIKDRRELVDASFFLMLYYIRVKKLDSVKKPKALISLLLKLIVCLSIVVFLVVAGLLIGAYFINNKTDVGAVSMWRRRWPNNGSRSMPM